MRNVLTLLALLVAMIAAPLAALAGDTLKLSDGSTIEGVVTREIDGYVWFRYDVAGIETEKMFGPSDYTELVRGADKVATDAEPARVTDPDRRTRERRSGAERAAVISLGDGVNEMVGVYMTAQTLRELIPMLEDEGITTVVFRVNSGGGLLLEIQRLSDVIHEEYKPRFRTVAWIESAISAAAMTAHCIEEIYFMPQGNYGACTGWSGALKAVEGRGLENVLYMMENISARGGYDPLLMRSMQIMDPLSVTIDEDGDVHYHADDSSGDLLLNAEGRILTLTSDQAEKIKFSRGTAATLDELTEEMGLVEVDWVGVDRSGVPYPVCRAEDAQIKWRERTAENERRFNEYFLDYQRTFGMAAGAGDEETRQRFAGMARKNLTRIAKVLRTNPNFALLQLNLVDEEAVKYWLEDQEEAIRDLLRD